MSSYQGLEVIIDWLEFTVLDTSLKDVIDRIIDLPFEEFTPLEKGRFGYQNQLKWKAGHVYVMFTAIGDITEDVRIKKETGVHVMITGQGCKQYSMNHSLETLLRLLSAQEKVNFSRIDLAIDDYQSKIINYDRIHQSAIDGHFTSRWSKWDEINSRQSSTGEFLGRTMYFGSQASDLFCRIYDKSLERKAKSEDDPKSIPKKWTRLELVYRKDRAKKLVEHVVKGEKPLGHVLRGTLRRYLRFILPSTDQNKSRWPTAKWWEHLLSNVEELQLTIKKESKSIEDMTAWVDKQISPTIAAIMKAQEGDMGWLRKIILKGSTRLTQKHLDAISTYQGRVAYE